MQRKKKHDPPKKNVFFFFASLTSLQCIFSYSYLRGSSQNFGIFFIIGPILLKFSHNM